MKALGYFVIRDLLHDRWRSVLSMISLAVIMVGYLLLSAASHTIKVQGKQTRVTNNLVVVAANAIDPMDSSLDDSLLETALAVDPDHIQRAFPTIFRHLKVGERITQVRAVPVEEMPAALGLTLVQGAWPAGLYEIVVGESIARVSHWDIGSLVNIYGTDFAVSGIVRSSEKNSGAIWLDYEAGLELFGERRGYQIAYLPLADNADPVSVQENLQADPRIQGKYTVFLENTLSSGYLQLSRNIVILGSLMAVLAMGAITFGIYNATSLCLVEHSSEIILLRVVGFSREKIRLFLTARALVLTLCAYALSMAAAAIIFAQQNANAPMGISDMQLILELNILSALLGFGLAVMFTFIGVGVTVRNLGLMTFAERGEGA